MNYEKQSLGADLYQLPYKCFFQIKRGLPPLKKNDAIFIIAPFFKFTIKI